MRFTSKITKRNVAVFLGMVFTLFSLCFAFNAMGGGRPSNVPQMPVAEAAGSGNVAENLDGDYAKIVSIKQDSVSTGTAPFDSDDTAGNDSSSDNLIVRSFDSASWNIAYAVDINEDSDYAYVRNARIGFRFIMPITDTDKVEFDLASMGWVDTTEGYQAKITTETINGKQCSVLTAYRRLESNDSTPTVIPGTGTVNVFIKTGMAENGLKIPMSVEAFAEHNESSEHVMQSLDDFTVSAAPRYNINLGQPSWVTGNGSWDFSKGNDKAINKSLGTVAGNLYAFGFMIELKNKDTSYGLKGVEVPKGDISFDVDLLSTITYDGKSVDLSENSDEKIAEGYKFQIYDINKVTEKIYPGSWGRSIYHVTQSLCPIYGPYTGNGGKFKTCYNGGDYSLAISPNGKTAHITLSGYSIAKNIWPQTSAGSANNRYDYVTKDGHIRNGVFSTGILYMIQPTSSINDGKYICNAFNTNDATVNIVATARNLSATSISGAKLIRDEKGNSNQTATNDDRSVYSRNVKTPGTLDGRLAYTYWGNNGRESGLDGKNWAYWWSHGYDSAIAGGKIRIASGCMLYPQSEANDPAFSMSLLKFDDKKLVPLEDTINYYPARGKAMYGAKKDGSGWSSFTEMRDTFTGGLMWYDSLSELKADNKVCVAILTICDEGAWQKESRLSRNMRCAFIPFKISENWEYVGTTANVCGETFAYTRKSLATQASEYSGKPSENMDDNEWRAFACNVDVIKSDHCVDVNSSSLPLIGGVAPSYYYLNGRNFVPAEYDENGLMHDKSGGMASGDTLLITGERIRVTNQIAQLDEKGGTKNVWDIDYQQRYADIVVRPEFASEKGGFQTEITLTATLPVGLSYVPNSSMIGGTYKANTPNAGSVSDGISLEPNATKNADGTTILVWKYPRQLTGESIKELHYSVLIGDASDPDNDVVNNQQLTIKHSVDTTYDKSPHSESEKDATVTIKISKLKQSSLSISVSPLINDVNQDFIFTNRLTNAGKTATVDAYAVSVLPNIENGLSDYHGSYVLKTLTVDPQKISNLKDVTIFITSDTSYNSKSSKDVPLSEIKTKWSKISLDTQTGIAMIPDKFKNATAFCVLNASLAPNESLMVYSTLTPSGNIGGDSYACRWGDIDTEVKANAYVADRKLTGKVWIDSNANGQQDINEPFVEANSISVSLIDSNDKIVTLLDGSKATVNVGIDGSYKIHNVPQGDYRVMFTKMSDKISYHRATKGAVGASSSNSDVVAVGGTLADISGDNALWKQQSFFVNGVTKTFNFPSIDSLVTSNFSIDNIDLGLVPGNSSISLTKQANLNDKNGNGTGDYNESIDYTFIVKNTGEVPLNNLKLTDDLLGIKDKIINTAVLAPGESITLKNGVSPFGPDDCSYRIGFFSNASGTITNVATVSADGLTGAKSMTSKSSVATPTSEVILPSTGGNGTFGVLFAVCGALCSVAMFLAGFLLRRFRANEMHGY